MSDFFFFCYAETDLKWGNHKLTLNINSLRRSTVFSDDNGRKLQFTDKCFKIHKYWGQFTHRNSVNAHRNSRNVIILAILTPGEMRLALNLME